MRSYSVHGISACVRTALKVLVHAYFVLYLRALINSVGSEVFTAVTIKNGVFWMLCRVALEKLEVSEERSASFIRLTRIGEIGTTLAVTSNRSKLRRNTK
jgi:hypothetical protein